MNFMSYSCLLKSLLLNLFHLNPNQRAPKIKRPAASRRRARTLLLWPKFRARGEMNPFRLPYPF